MSQTRFHMLDQTVNSLATVDNHITKGMETVVDCAQDLSEISLLSDVSPGQMAEIKEVMHRLVEMKQELRHFYVAADYVKEQSAENSENTEKNMLALFNEKMADLKAATTEEDITHHELYATFTNIQKKIEEEKKQNKTGSDEEIAITQEVENTRCAITGKEMKDPVQNKVCGHNYDRQGIEHYLTTRPNGKCPVSGCTSDAPVQACNLTGNKDLKRYIDKLKRTKAKQQERSDNRVPSIPL